MASIGTPLTHTATKVMLCGSGELGKELAIELQRLGCEVIAIDHYENAPAMQVAHRCHVINMLDEIALKNIIREEKPHYILPEVEAIATQTLIEMEQEGYTIAPNARAVQLTMDREGIRRLVAEKLKLPTSPYYFAENLQQLKEAINKLGYPCIIKPVMSSSGKGQTVIKTESDIEQAWTYAQEGGRAGKGKVIIEGFIDFDYEITLLTVRHYNGTSYCQPIGHRQEAGDYRESWQPQPMTKNAIEKAQHIAKQITDELGGFGIFGVELFIKNDQVWFNEISPRPHDTGLVTLISQDLSEFALHARAVLGLSIPNIEQHGAAASAALLAEGQSSQVLYSNLQQALTEPQTDIRLFGKPQVNGRRRMGVTLAKADTIENAIKKAIKVKQNIKITL